MNQSIKWLTYLKSQSEQWVEQNSKADLCPLTLCGICSQLCTEENKYIYISVQFSRSVVSNLCDPLDCSTLGLLVHHQLPESIQTHVHRVGDTIQPSHPLSFPLLLASISSRLRVFSNESVLRIRWPKY